MPIVGFSIRSIEGRRNKSRISGEIKVNSTPRINDVREVEIPAFKNKVISLSFDFTTIYEPELAKIKIIGNVLLLTNNNKTIINKWKKERALPENISVEVLNHLFRRCLIKIAGIADELQLPPPIQIPRVKAKGEEAGYIG